MSRSLALMPQSLKQDKFTVATIEAFEMQMNQLHDEFINLCDFFEFANLPEAVIDLIAFDRHVDFYESLSLEEKRKFVKNAIQIHAKKGTKYALKQVFNMLFLNGDVEEWFEYEGDEYHFKVLIDITDRGVSDETLELLDRLIAVYKNNRSVLEQVHVSLANVAPTFTGIYVSLGEEITVDG